MPDRLFMEIPASLKYLRLASKFGFNAALTLAEGEPTDQTEFADALELALNEAVTNSIRHRDPEAPEASVIVEMWLDSDEMTVSVRDTNAPFDSDLVPAPNLDAHPENGYGIHLMKGVMDQVTTSREHGWNILTMKKKRGRSQ